MVEISFPGLGIDNFTVNPVAFELFGLEVRWYGICIMLGMIAAFGYAMYRSRREGFVPDDVLDMGLFLVIFGVLGARAYYVIMELDRYIMDNLWDTLAAMVNIRGGGLAIYGGIIAGGLTLYIWCRVKKRDWRRALDMVGPGVMLAQAMGRWGNFFNGEAYGGIVAEGSPLYFLRMGLYPNNVASGMAYVHPTFLYESLWNVLGFVLINAFLYRRKKFGGQIFLTYIAWYGFGRMFIEGLRTDSLYIFGTVRVSQLVGFLCFLGGTALIVWQLIKLSREGKAREYTPVYATAQSEVPAQENTQTEIAEEQTEIHMTDAEEQVSDGQNNTKE